LSSLGSGIAELGKIVTGETPAGSTITTVDWVPLYEPVTVTGAAALRKLVNILKVADVCPAGTVVLGSIAIALSLLPVSVTTAPPAGAGLVNVTVPVN